MANADLEVIAGRDLAEAALTLSVAESCSGGLLGHLLTNVPGSSAYFLGGVIAYSDDLKRTLLGVPDAVIWQNGAVSAECALSMARGARRITGSDLALAITGIAGPGGGSPDKPVGTVYVALVGEDVERVERFCWGADRAGNKALSARAALDLLIEHLGVHASINTKESASN
jgi:PncC family amidohydrolase